MTEIRLGPGDWDTALADASGPQLVVAGPGAGKTEFLVRRTRHLIASGVPPESILLLAFSRRGAAELRTRVSAGLTRSFSVVAAATFHSLAMRLLEAHGPIGGWQRTPTLLTGPEHVELVAELLAAEDPAGWPLPFRTVLASRAFAEEVADFVLRAAERLAEPDDLEAMGRADWRALPGFVRRYRDSLVERGRIDYGTLQVEALRILDHPETASGLAATFSHVLVDEYQDTTVAQARISEHLAAVHRNLTVAGDPYQSVYSFRGAELTNVAEFPDRFRDASGQPARRIVLTHSFRVPAAILDAAVRLTSGAGLPGSAGPVEPAPGIGAVETYGFDQQSGEAEWIAAELQRLHLVDRIPYRRMGVLVRSKRRFLPELSRALDRRRIPHARPDTRLADHPAVRPVLDLAEAACGDTGALRRVLMGPLVALTLSATREIERRASVEGWTVALQGRGEAVDLVRGLLAEPAWATTDAAADGFWTLWTALPGLPAIALADADNRRALASFSQALERLRERDPGAGLAGYAAMMRREDFEAEPLLSLRDAGADRVTLTTLHQAKGMEFEVVFIADAREGVLPDLRARDSLLGTRHLSPALSGDDRAYARFRVQEERRLAYTAMCRASRRVVWTCTVGSPDHTEGTPSRFLALVAGRPLDEAVRPPDETTRPTTPRDAEAWLRRRLGDPSLPAAERIAALGALAEGDWRPRPITEFAGILAHGPDTGLIDPEPRLSPSQAESYADCPRRYAFERLLRISDGGSKSASLGSVLHRVLEIAERDAVAAGRDHGEVEHAVEVFAAEFDPAEFDGPPWSDSWHRRGERILRHLYEYWPGKGPAVGFESAVSHQLDGVTWVGRVDRAEQRSDGVHIIDYKTGTSVKKLDEAAGAVQLGFYVLASGEGVTGAEFWYPGDSPGKRKSVTVRRFEMNRLPEVRDEMLRVQVGILAEQWPPTPGDHCERCPVRIVCPEWPEGREAYS